MLDYFKSIEQAMPLIREIKTEMNSIRKDHMRFRDLIDELVMQESLDRAIYQMKEETRINVDERIK